MEVLVVFNKLTVQSHKGPYSVFFDDKFKLVQLGEGHLYFLIDSKVIRLYSEELRPILGQSNTLLIEATEENKSIEHIIPIIEQLVAHKIRRDHTLIAIGGGIIQDITCFIASTLLRGINWKFVPTTLLAQADSCIGSKSSINLGATKNILGTFNPPSEIFICSQFLDTLEDKDIRSGIGEILKVHAIESASAYDRLAADYDSLWTDRNILLGYIRQALLIKQRFIEIDEFDKGVRNIFNYGHSFGHAIESATNFYVPHGVAVTMGMAMANHIAVQRGLLPEQHAVRMKSVLHKNYYPFASTPIAVDALLSALMKDKKNTASKLALIFPVGDTAIIQRVEVVPDQAFYQQCQLALNEISL